MLFRSSPEGLAELESLCQKSGYPFSRFCRELALVSQCVLAGVSPQLAEHYCNALGALAAGQQLPTLSPARRAERLCGGPVRLSPQAEELLQRRDLWYADGVLRAMGTLRGPAFLDALAASLPLEEPPVRFPAETFLSWHPGPMLSLKSQTAQIAIRRLCGYLKRVYGKNVIVLLDEYDTPMQEAWVYGYWNHAVAFFRSFFVTTFKDNDSIERGLITGITRISYGSQSEKIGRAHV